MEFELEISKDENFHGFLSLFFLCAARRSTDTVAIKKVLVRLKKCREENWKSMKEEARKELKEFKGTAKWSREEVVKLGSEWKMKFKA